jgi:hypothetical protein
MTTGWVVAVVGVSAIALAVAGCPLPNPCPFGKTPRGKLCVAPPDGSTGSDQGGAPEPMPSATDEDASPEANDEQDAAGELQDGGMEPTPGSEDGDVDAETTPGGGEMGSGGDGGDDSAAACGTDDLALWRNFQLSGRTVLAMKDCGALGLSCTVPLCDLDSCMREAAGVSGCEACVADEMSCIIGYCAAACDASDAFDTCRKCACDNGCMAAATACGSRELDVCFDCRGATCQTISTDPSLVMQIFNYGSMIAPLIP